MIYGFTRKEHIMSLAIFYSWQSDIDTDVNKFFIKSALEKAIASLKNELKVEDSEREDISLDHDTKNVPGSPPIVDTILQKIDQCGIFLSDLTYVAHVPDKHGVSNPNVLTERGYALKAVGHLRMIAVMNDAYGVADNLPFDLKGIRWPLRYSLHHTDNKEKRKEQETLLATKLKEAIRLILDSNVISDQATNPIDVIKEYLLNPQKLIKVHEVINKEVDRVCESLQSEQFSLGNPGRTYECMWDRAKEYENLLKPIVNMLVVGCSWGDKSHFSIWEDAIRRISINSFYKTGNYYRHWEELAIFPSLFLFYACGVTALKKRKYDTLFMLFNLHIVIPISYHEEPITSISPAYLPLLKPQRGFNIPNYGSRHLFEILRVYLNQIILNDIEYEYFFGLFELIYNLVFIFKRKQSGGTRHHEFCSKEFRSLRSSNAVEEFKAEILHLKNDHPLLVSGFFDGKFENILEALQALQNPEGYMQSA